MKEPMVPLSVAENLAHAMEEVIDCDEKATEQLAQIGVKADTSLVDLMKKALEEYKAWKRAKKIL